MGDRFSPEYAQVRKRHSITDGMLTEYQQIGHVRGVQKNESDERPFVHLERDLIFIQADLLPMICGSTRHLPYGNRSEFIRGEPGVSVLVSNDPNLKHHMSSLHTMDGLFQRFERDVALDSGNHRNGVRRASQEQALSTCQFLSEDRFGINACLAHFVHLAPSSKGNLRRIYMPIDNM